VTLAAVALGVVIGLVLGVCLTGAALARWVVRERARREEAELGLNWATHRLERLHQELRDRPRLVVIPGGRRRRF
jgi:di/tricarboxylate transporter